MKKIACIISSAPYGTQTAKGALDIIMACAAFDYPPDLFFTDDGILQLIKAQNAQLISQKNIASMLKSLPLFDVNNIYLCKASIAERNITIDDLIFSPYCFERKELPLLLEQYSVILTF